MYANPLFSEMPWQCWFLPNVGKFAVFEDLNYKTN